MHLGLYFQPTGHHTASWRHPDAQADAAVNIAFALETAQTAERAKFDFIFLADSLCVHEPPIEAMRRQANGLAHFEPVTLLSAMAGVTSHLGLVCTQTTSFNEPYNVARTMASLDWISNGRAGWNIVTGSMNVEAQNFGLDALPDHDERYRRAREFTDVVRGLWDSWDDDAFVRDKESGEFFDPAKLHHLNHRGEFYSVRGPLNIARPPQGYPVLFQAGSSDTGRSFAADVGDAIFAASLGIGEAREYYADIKRRVAVAGRDPAGCKVLPGITYSVAATQAEAEERYAAMMTLVHPLAARTTASRIIGHDLSPYPLDEPVPDLPEPNGSIGGFRLAMKLARDEKLTVRELCLRLAHGRNRFVVVGSAKQVADTLEEWVTTGAADGFIILPTYMPGALDDFVELVIPELQRRGVFRSEYSGATLRDNLGLLRPSSRYATSVSQSL